jgi:hypothetical protein
MYDDLLDNRKATARIAMATELTHLEAFVGSVEGDQFAVVQARHISEDKRQRSRIAQSLISTGAVKKMLVVEKIGGVDAERIDLDCYPIEHQSGQHSEDLVGQLAVTGLAMNFLSAGRNHGTKLLHHKSTDMFAEVTWSDSQTYFRIGVQQALNRQSFDMAPQLSHAYTKQPLAQIVTADGFTVLASVLPISELVLALPGKSFLLIVKLESLNAGKRPSKGADKRTPLSPAGEVNLQALIKHVAASLHVAQASIATLLITSAVGGDFSAFEWVNNEQNSYLATKITSPSLLALSELGITLGSIVQGFARVLPGVPLRISHHDGIAEVLAERGGSLGAPRAVIQWIHAKPIMHGRLFFAAP